MQDKVEIKNDNCGIFYKIKCLDPKKQNEFVPVLLLFEFEMFSSNSN